MEIWTCLGKFISKNINLFILLLIYSQELANVNDKLTVANEEVFKQLRDNGEVSYIKLNILNNFFI